MGSKLSSFSTPILSCSNILLISRPTKFPSSHLRRRHHFRRHGGFNFYSTDFPAEDSIAIREVSAVRNTVRSPTLVALEYADLNLPDKFSEDLSHVRIRQHVNPLRSSLMVPAQAPDWNVVYKDATLPLMVDIGCGSGRFLMLLAKRNGGFMNYLGLEIRQKVWLAERAKYWANELGLNNIHFMFANAMVSFNELVSSYPGPLILVSILCPDPHFKKKYHKRRVVQKPLVDSILSYLMPNGQVFIESDVLEVAVDMRNKLDEKSDKLIHIDKIDPNMICNNEGWLLNNPMGIRTEREIHAEYEGSKIYRRFYQKLM